MILKQKRLTSINRKLMKTMKRKELEKRYNTKDLERSNVSNMADYIIGETMGNGVNFLDTQ